MTTLQNFIYPGHYRMDADAAQLRLEEIKSKIILALPADVWRRIKDACNAEGRYSSAESEQDFIIEALTNHLDATYEGTTVRELAATFHQERARYVAEYGELALPSDERAAGLTMAASRLGI